jgi:hypothetical protein
MGAAQIQQSVKAHLMFNSSIWHSIILLFVILDGLLLFLDMTRKREISLESLFVFSCVVDVCVVVVFSLEIWMMFVAYGKKYAIAMIKLKVDAAILLLALVNSGELPNLQM